MAQENLKAEMVPPVPGAPPSLELAPAGEAAPVVPRATKSPFLTPGNLMLVAAFAAGFVVLYGLRMRNGPASALADQNQVHAKVEAALNSLGTLPSEVDLQQKGTAKAIVNEFYTAARQRQVDRSALRGNPFQYESARAPEPTTAPAAPIQLRNEVPTDEKRALEAIKSFKLQSVLVGRQKTAMISNNLVTEGSILAGWTVVRIGPREVELQWKDRTHELRMAK